MNTRELRWQAFRNSLYNRTHGSDPLWSRRYFDSILALNQCYWCLGELTVAHESAVPLDWIYGNLRVARNCVPGCCECIDIRQTGRFSFEEMGLLRHGLVQIRKQRLVAKEPTEIPLANIR